jgi:hypothetical protein
MNNLSTLRKIMAKCFRKAKRRYAVYLLSQCVILVFAVVSILTEVNPNLSAVIAFIAVLATETIRWRSDCWKSEGETALRKLEAAEGLGVAVDSTFIADWLAAKPKGFLADVSTNDTAGSEFDSADIRGPIRVVKNTRESAWWSKHLSNRIVIYLSLILVVVVVGIFIALTISIGALNNTSVRHSATVVQNVGGILCSLLGFVFSINAIRLLLDFWTFAAEARDVLNRCGELLKRSDVTEREALSVLHDYQMARNSAPLLPTFVWKLHGNHLREQWSLFSGESGV